MNGCQRNLTTQAVPWCSLETFQTLNLAPGVQISQGLPTLLLISFLKTTFMLYRFKRKDLKSVLEKKRISYNYSPVVQWPSIVGLGLQTEVRIFSGLPTFFIKSLLVDLISESYQGKSLPSQSKNFPVFSIDRVSITFLIPFIDS